MGYEGVDVDRIARAVGVTKPCLYREFGDKPSLLLKAVKRYKEIYGAAVIQAFQAETEIRKAVTAFCEAAITTYTGDRRTRYFMARSALGQSERVAEIREFFVRALAANADVLAQRFEKEISAKRLSAKISAKVRGRILIDMMQGARTPCPQRRSSRGTPVWDARSHMQLVLS